MNCDCGQITRIRISLVAFCELNMSLLEGRVQEMTLGFFWKRRDIAILTKYSESQERPETPFEA
jgi:hypothetical protein